MVNYAVSLLSIAFLLLVWFHFYKQFRIDSFRYNLFGLRNELFDLAALGSLNFEDRAYGMLRGSINGTIRHAHRLNLIELLVFSFVQDRTKYPKIATSFAREWSKACSELDENTEKKVVRIYNQLQMLRLIHIVKTSFILFLVLSVLKIVFPLVTSLQTHMGKWARGFLNGNIHALKAINSYDSIITYDLILLGEYTP